MVYCVHVLSTRTQVTPRRPLTTARVTTVDPSDVDSQPEFRLALTPADMEQRKVLDLKRW